MPFVLAQQEFIAFAENIPLWQSLLALFLMSPVVMGVINGIMLYQQNRQKQDLSKLEAKQAEDEAERKQQKTLIDSQITTNLQLLELFRSSLANSEKRDERYIQTLNNLDKTVGAFGNIFQEENQERSEVFAAIKEMLVKQTAGLEANSEAMFALSENQDHAVKAMERTSQETQRSVEEMKLMLTQLNGKLDVWGQLFQSAIGTNLKTNDHLGGLESSIQDLMGYVRTEIGKLITAVESKEANPHILDKEHIL